MKYTIDHSKTSGSTYEINACSHWDFWALPLCIYWWKHADGLYNARLDISVHLFCFSLHFEWFRIKGE